MRAQEERLYALIEPTVLSLGFDLVCVFLQRAGKSTRASMQVLIDRKAGSEESGGVTLDDCAKVSHRIGGLLDVEIEMPDAFDLEVSSPGADRPLCRERDFVRFAGSESEIVLRKAIEGRRRFVGELGGCDDGVVVMVEEGGIEHRFELAAIKSARLVPQW
ncbi:ribosome maturation factor RimP [Thioalkalivibrio sp. HK1]|uniref:ribosome maturation factor RimP n=1 Tax=Thioalkalivibrio sp. HK1 TaxID=1469245 RepID=UPI000470CC73|nr:ribosome maturation factor RimP [Thioalkalivibrio sp. HK1]